MSFVAIKVEREFHELLPRAFTVYRNDF